MSGVLPWISSAELVVDSSESGIGGFAGSILAISSAELSTINPAELNAIGPADP
jgi:hypothetical protein